VWERDRYVGCSVWERQRQIDMWVVVCKRYRDIKTKVHRPSVVLNINVWYSTIQLYYVNIHVLGDE